MVNIISKCACPSVKRGQAARLFNFFMLNSTKHENYNAL